MTHPTLESEYSCHFVICSLPDGTLKALCQFVYSDTRKPKIRFIEDEMGLRLKFEDSPFSGLEKAVKGLMGIER